MNGAGIRVPCSHRVHAHSARMFTLPTCVPLYAAVHRVRIVACGHCPGDGRPGIAETPVQRDSRCSWAIDHNCDFPVLSRTVALKPVATPSVSSARHFHGRPSTSITILRRVFHAHSTSSRIGAIVHTCTQWAHARSVHMWKHCIRCTHASTMHTVHMRTMGAVSARVDSACRVRSGSV